MRALRSCPALLCGLTLLSCGQAVGSAAPDLDGTDTTPINDTDTTEADGSSSEVATSVANPPPSATVEAPVPPSVTPPGSDDTSAPEPTDDNPMAPSGSPPAAPPTPRPNPDPPLQPQGSSIRPGSGPLGNETTCDASDDDSNGVKDDVDADGDNVCDCLRVATLGLHGEWGDGDVITGWFAERLELPVEPLDGEALSAERLAPYQVVLVRDVSTNHSPGLSFSESEVNALWNWVRDGGGLMTVIGYSDAGEASNVNRLLEPFGLSYGSDQIVQGQGASVPVTEWFEHPLTAGITQVGADNGYPAVGQGLTIAARDGFDLGKAASIGDGHVLLWGDEWITYEGEWRDDTTYQVERFWKNALRWLTRVNECQVPPPQ